MEDVDQVAAARLRAHGQRYTKNRRELMELLSAAASPLTIPEILDRRAGLAQSSVYRNLMLLEQSGLVQRIVTNDDWARFELAEDLTEHHHHLICSNCGVVRDFTVPPQVEKSVATAFAAIADETGFHLQHHRLDLVGVCPACAA
jgi:Fur family transcriptional regulator, ferric uptake regulator